MQPRKLLCVILGFIFGATLLWIMAFAPQSLLMTESIKSQQLDCTANLPYRSFLPLIAVARYNVNTAPTATLPTPTATPSCVPSPTATPSHTPTSTLSSTNTPPPSPPSTNTPTATAPPRNTPTQTPSIMPTSVPILLAAGDIASCVSNGDEATANLLDTLNGVLITLGDNAYDNGTATEFANCYHPTWGRHKARTFPSPGNHDYNTPNATGYYGYFGARAGDPTKGYYSFDIGAWHLIALNSNCAAIGGCGVSSPQYNWLVADLTAHTRPCTLAYWHHPRFSSGAHGNNATYAAFWQALYAAGADVVLNGHDHNYERFAPQDPNANADLTNGIHAFVVGTGGALLRGFNTPVANSEMRDSSTWGILKLTLHATSYDWQFVPVAGGAFSDSGSGICH